MCKLRLSCRYISLVCSTCSSCIPLPILPFGLVACTFVPFFPTNFLEIAVYVNALVSKRPSLLKWTVSLLCRIFNSVFEPAGIPELSNLCRKRLVNYRKGLSQTLKVWLEVPVWTQPMWLKVEFCHFFKLLLLIYYNCVSQISSYSMECYFFSIVDYFTFVRIDDTPGWREALWE